jgi:bifunctional oligoribonuclease and PAP phosphatase NrnA
MILPSYVETDKIKELVDGANHIVVVQADNPDVDSLASALALEHILGDQGKQITLYCGVDIPSYMNYLPGWDRVVKELPNQFDLSVVVDTSSNGLLEQLDKNGLKGWLSAKPCVVIDHHATEATISFATIICNQTAVATGEVIYELARQLDWTLNPEAKKLVASAILGDSLGLMTVDTSARSIQIISELVEGGVQLADLENARRETMRREPELIPYKGQLLQRVEFLGDGRIASLVIPWEEIEKYSPLYNPPMLVMDDMRLAKGTDVAVCFKLYTDGKITAKIRCNYGYGIADKLAEHFGGGGHPYAAGFKIRDGRSYEDIKNETVQLGVSLLKEKDEVNAAT